MRISVLAETFQFGGLNRVKMIEKHVGTHRRAGRILLNPAVETFGSAPFGTRLRIIGRDLSAHRRDGGKIRTGLGLR